MAEAAPVYGTSLPAGKSCSDCANWKRCRKSLKLEGTETRCTSGRLSFRLPPQQASCFEMMGAPAPAPAPAPAGSFFAVVNGLAARSAAEWEEARLALKAYGFRLLQVSDGGIWRAADSKREADTIRGTTAAELIVNVEAWALKHNRPKSEGDSKGKKAAASATGAESSDG